MDVAEVEVRLEAVRVEADRALVERLRLDQLVARVVDVGEVDDRRHQVGIDPAPGGRPRRPPPCSARRHRRARALDEGTSRRARACGRRSARRRPAGSGDASLRRRGRAATTFGARACRTRRGRNGNRAAAGPGARDAAREGSPRSGVPRSSSAGDLLDREQVGEAVDARRAAARPRPGPTSPGSAGGSR